MNSTTVATVVAAGLAMATLAAGSIALWLYRSSKLEAPPTPQPQPSNPEPRQRAPTMREETRSEFEEPFGDLFGSHNRDAPEPPAKPPPSTKPPDREAPKPWPVDPARFAARRAEVEAEFERKLRATEVPPPGPRRSTAPTKVRTARAVEPTNRKHRYTVRPGQPIEVVVGDAPPGAKWRPSRNDVEVQLIERHGDRLCFTLHGPSGNVNVGLVQDGVKRVKAIRSWKFELSDAAA